MYGSAANSLRSQGLCCSCWWDLPQRHNWASGWLGWGSLNSTRLFYGSPEHATPRTRTDAPNYQSGNCTGAVVENADLTGVQNLSAAQRYYCCAFGGEKTRKTIPGGCQDIPNLLGR